MKKQKIMENTKSFAVIKKEHFYKIKRKDGVTLIALVITVIIMLILARSSDISINSKRWIIWENK